MKIYELRNNFNYPQFSKKGTSVFTQNTLRWTDNLKEETYYYDIDSSLSGKKNFNVDISLQNNHLILSDKACELFKKYGTLFDVQTKSKRKLFRGFFPNKCISDSSYLNLRTSDFYILDNGNISFSHIYFNEKIKDIKLEVFVIDNVLLTIYVTDEFKKKIEQKGLLGLDFILVYDSSLPVDWKFQVIKDGLDNPDYEDVIRKVYGFSGDVKDFDLYVTDKEVVEEQPFLELYEKYQSQISTISKDYPLITEYQVLCVLDKNLRDFIPYLKKFNQFLIDKNIFLKTKYIGMFPQIDIFEDGVMVGGRFAKGLKIKA